MRKFVCNECKHKDGVYECSLTINDEVLLPTQAPIECPLLNGCACWMEVKP